MKKIIQITAAYAGEQDYTLYALTEDGRVYYLSFEFKEGKGIRKWKELKETI